MIVLSNTCISIHTTNISTSDPFEMKVMYYLSCNIQQVRFSVTLRKPIHVSLLYYLSEKENTWRCSFCLGKLKVSVIPEVQQDGFSSTGISSR